MEAPTVRPPLTRYECPIPSCPWHHDEPDSPEDVATTFRTLTQRDLAAAVDLLGTTGDPLADLCGAASLKRARLVDGELWRHFQTHPIPEWMREVLRIRARFAELGHEPSAVASPTAPPSLRDWVLEVLRLQNELAALERRRADEAAAAG